MNGSSVDIAKIGRGYEMAIRPVWTARDKVEKRAACV
jgi:hypothetical protein